MGGGSVGLWDVSFNLGAVCVMRGQRQTETLIRYNDVEQRRRHIIIWIHHHQCKGRLAADLKDYTSMWQKSTIKHIRKGFSSWPSIPLQWKNNQDKQQPRQQWRKESWRSSEPQEYRHQWMFSNRKVKPFLLRSLTLSLPSLTQSINQPTNHRDEKRQTKYRSCNNYLQWKFCIKFGFVQIILRSFFSPIHYYTNQPTHRTTWSSPNTGGSHPPSSKRLDINVRTTGIQSS